MNKITFEEKEYFYPTSWEEITLDQFIQICNIEIPGKLRELYIAAAGLNNTNEDEAAEASKQYDEISAKINVNDLVRIFPAYYGKVMTVLTGIPQSVMQRVHGDLRSEFFDQFCRYIVLSVFYSTPVIDTGDGMIPYVPEEIKSFELEGQVYLLPKTLNVYGEDIFLAKETAASFSEASDIDMAFRDLYEKGAERIPMLVSVYCRPDGEQYDEEKVVEREPLMRSLTMNVVWSVFFCIVMLSGRYSSFIQGFTKGVLRLISEAQ